MTDMSLHISPKSDQLNADDLIGGPRIITVTRVSENAGGSGADQPVNVFFEGDNGKPFRPCKSMRRVMVAVWGKDAAQYAGRSMKIWRDPDVTWGGMKVGGIRISHMTHMEKPEIMALTATKSQRKPYRVDPLEVSQAPKPAAPDPDILEEARQFAAKGSDAFRKWFSENPDKRAAAKTIMPELQAKALDADAAKAEVTDEDPFGLPPVADTDTAHTEEEKAAILEEERAASQAT